MKTEAKESVFDVLKNLIPLFAVEIMLLTVMNFANLSIVYRYLAIFLMVVAFIQIIKFIPKDKTIVPFFIQIGGLLLFEIISSIFGYGSVFKSSVQGSLLSSILTVVSLIFGSLAFYIIGGYYGLFHKNKLDITKLIGTFYAGIGIYVLLCLAITIYGMGTPFHTIVFLKNSTYSGLVKQAGILIGFDTILHPNGVAIIENMSLIASTGLLTLFFTDRKKNPIFFYGSLVGGVCGALAIILLPLVIVGCILVLALVFALLIKLPIKNKKVALISFFSVAAALTIGYAIFRIDNHFHAERYKSLNYVARAIIFPNIGIFSNLSNIKDMFSNLPAIIGQSSQVKQTGTFILNVAYQNGVLALLFLLTFFVFVGIEVFKFCKNSDNMALKIVITSICLSYFGTILINDMGFELVTDFVFLGVLVFFGYITTYNIEHKSSLEIKSTEE
ncbi:MAG: hypothetical protein J1F31_04675 [Erysipelotrichales bacterium]|nr:hypothetical protein [Erysipelotrichales bacterium]